MKLPFFPYFKYQVDMSQRLGDTELTKAGSTRAQTDSIGSQIIHSKGTAYDITKYQAFLTKYEIVCPFKGKF